MLITVKLQRIPMVAILNSKRGGQIKIHC